MKRIYRLAVLLLVALPAMAGCGTCKGAAANLAFWTTIGPRHEAYIDGDATLNADDKRVRKQEVEEAVQHAKDMAR